MFKFLATLSLALFTATVSATDMRLADHVNKQIAFANEKGLCYAPVVFQDNATPAEIAAVKVAAEKRNWKLGHHQGRVVNVEKKTCKRA